MSLKQLCAAGLSPSAVHKRCAGGHLHRIHGGVYGVAPAALLSREGRWMAAVLACGPDAVLSHRSAAALHELGSFHPRRVDVTVPGRSRGGHSGLFIHRSTTLTPEDLTTVRGIPCTTVARALLDLASARLGRRALERACDQAEILGVFDLHALLDQLERNPHRRGAGLLRAVLNTHYIGQTPTWSELEERFLALVRAAGLPLPEVNAWVDPHDGEPPLRVDFVWRRQKLAVETDGYRTHGTRQAFARDRRRDQRLTVAGWRSLRPTWGQITRTPGELQQALRQLLNS